uniref:BTB domain-containing protein n=1 Tax=Bracon brevicornis TaxID=1563983 RepID=A0A6V7JA52_9HYME
MAWRLRLYPGGLNPESGFVTPTLNLITPGSASPDIALFCEFSFVVRDKVIVHSKVQYKFNKLMGMGPSKFIQRAQMIAACAPDDSFTILCTIQRPSNVPNLTKPLTLFPMEGNEIGDDCNELLKEPYPFSDLTIIVGEEKISAHKAFLVARSPVFAAEFSIKLQKSSRMVILEIPDMEPKIIRAMLEFIYTDRVTDLGQIASGLIVAAHKYDLKRLKIMCQESLYENLSTTTAAHTLVIADQYGSPALTQATINFIADHYHEVTESDGFKKITDADLLKKLMHTIATRRC